MSDTSYDSIAAKYPWRKKPTGWYPYGNNPAPGYEGMAEPRRRITRSMSTPRRDTSAPPAPPSTQTGRGRGKTPKKGDLKKVPAGISTAYGADGKVQLSGQIDVEGGDTFAGNFFSNRGDALGRDNASEPGAARSREGSVVPTPRSTRSAARKTNPITLLDPIQDDDEEEEAEDEIPPAHDDPHAQEESNLGRRTEHNTTVHSTFIYPRGDQSHASLHSSNPTPNRSRGFSRSVASVAPQPSQQEIDAATPFPPTVFWETARLYMNEILGWIVYILCVMAFLLLCWNILSRQSRQWLNDNVFSHVTIPAVTVGKPGGYENLQTSIGDLRDDLSATQQQLTSLKKLLPEHVMVQRGADGQWELPTNFWSALRDKLSEQQSSISWETFLKSNQAKLDAVTRRSVDQALSTNQHIISSDMVMDQLRTLATEVSQEATAEYMHVFASMDRHNKLYTLALTNTAKNTLLAIKTVNYFSWGLGARIINSLTSTTHTRHRTLWQAFYYRTPFYDGAADHPSLEALKRWEEATDCWCAAQSSDKGKAQLGVAMPFPINVSSITIEHIPATGTVDIKSAPKGFEVWVRGTGALVDFSCGAAPAEGFVCVGKGHYNIHAPNHVQNFILEPIAGGPVTDAVVKVTSNWGGDYTCFYRVRLHGQSDVMRDAKGGEQQLWHDPPGVADYDEEMVTTVTAGDEGS